MTATPHTETTSGAPTEEDTAVVNRASHGAPLGYGPASHNPGYGPGYGAPYGYGPAVPPPYGPKHTVTGGPATPSRGLARVPRAAWLAAAAALALVEILVAVIVAGNGGGSTSATPSGSTAPAAAESAPGDPAKLVPTAQLPGLLLTPAEIATAVGLPGSERDAKAGAVTSVPFVDKLASNQECVPAAYPANRDAFQGTGFSGMRAQASSVRLPSDDARSWFFSQGMFVYPSTAAAETAVQKNTAALKACEGQSWSEANQYANGGPSVFWNAGTVNTDGSGLVTMQNRQENANGWGCWRAMKAEANVVVDFSVCALDKPESVPAALANAITQKIPTT